MRPAGSPVKRSLYLLEDWIVWLVVVMMTLEDVWFQMIGSAGPLTGP